MKKGHTFTVCRDIWQVAGKQGKPCWHAIEDHGTGGSGGAFDTKEEAEQWLYNHQKQHGIPDREIEWIGLEPQNAVEQMELAFL